MLISKNKPFFLVTTSSNYETVSTLIKNYCCESQIEFFMVDFCPLLLRVDFFAEGINTACKR